MRAVRQHAVGEPFVVESVPEPVPGPDDVIVAITRAAVNPIDVWVGLGRGIQPPRFPRTPGCEGAGTTADGARVRFRGAGLGITRDGAYAEYAAVPAVALTPVPDGVSDAEAAATGIIGVTALDCLDLGDVGPDSRVLVLGASGGVGSFAVDLARSRGATVIAQTSSPTRAAALVGRADAVVISTGDDLEEAVRATGIAVDVVLDGLGGPFGAPAIRLLEPSGTLVMYGASAGQSFPLTSVDLYRKRARILGYAGLADDAAEQAARAGGLLTAIADGTLRRPAYEELPLGDAWLAHERVRTNDVGGKLLLDPSR